MKLNISWFEFVLLPTSRRMRFLELISTYDPKTGLFKEDENK
jgi:hypothetical protein